MLLWEPCFPVIQRGFRVEMPCRLMRSSPFTKYPALGGDRSDPDTDTAVGNNGKGSIRKT